jgi:predicted transcriptional regulator
MTTIAWSSALAATDARTVMSAGLVTCRACASLTDVAALMSVHQVHAVVVDPGAPRLITARDVVRGTLAGATSVDEAIVGGPPSAAPEDSLQAIAERMVSEDEGHVVVREHGDGQARGMVSSFDIVAVLAGHDPRVARIVRPAPARPAFSGGLSGRAVRDVMHRGVISCAAGAPLAEMAAVLVERRTHSAMVSDADRLAFVTDMDLIAAVVRGDPAPTAGELASAGLAMVRSDAKLDLAASLVATSPVGHVVAVDLEGFPVGVVSTLDLVGAIATG